MREAVSKDVFANTPTDYVVHCQMACLFAAVRAADLLADLYRLGFRKSYGIPNLVVGIYQIAQIMVRLQRLICGGNESALDAAVVMNSIRDARRMISFLQPTSRLRPKTSEILAETDNLIHELARGLLPDQEPGSYVVQFSPSNTGQLDSGQRAWQPSDPHLASKGSFLDDIEIQTNLVSEPAAADTVSSSRTNEALDSNTPNTRRDYVGNHASLEVQAGEGLMSLQNSTIYPPPSGMINDRSDVWASADRLGPQRQLSGNDIPWDPFELQLCDHYDPELETVLFSLSSA